MGQSRSNPNVPAHREIRSGAYVCVYCGGGRVATEPDHMPPRSFFKRRARPNDLIVPACVACNRGSKDIDQILSFLGRIYHTHAEQDYFDGTGRLVSAVNNNYPEIIISINKENETPLHVEMDAAAISIEQNIYTERVCNLIGLNLGLALHWKSTGQVVPPTGGAIVKMYSNVDAKENRIPHDYLRLFTGPSTLRQGSFEVGDQFEYQSTFDQIKPIGIHVCTFNLSLMFVVYVSTDTPALGLPESYWIRPGAFIGGWPYGLPRMSGIDIMRRKLSMINHPMQGLI